MKALGSTLSGKNCLFYLFIIFVSIPSKLIFSQGAIGIADKTVDPIRLNMVRPQFDLPNAQRPPYEWSGAYLRNAFSNLGENSAVFLLDSSLCGNGQMNSTGYTDHLKIFYTYNNDHQLSTATYKHLRPGGEYENYSRKLYHYENGKRASFSFQVWEYITQEWRNDYQEKTTYDTEGRMIEFSSRTKNESGEWEFVRREQVNYDSDGNLIELMVSNGYGNSWIPEHRLEAAYNEDDFYTHIYHQIWMGDNWETLTRETAIFHEGTSLWKAYLMEEKNSSTGEFEYVSRELYSYNSRGFWTGTERQEWNAQLQIWQNILREKYSYTRRGVWVGWLQQGWSGVEWVNTIRQKYTSSEEGRIDLAQEWDVMNGEWVNAFRNVIKFDDNNNLEKEIGRQKWNNATGSWSVLPETRMCKHSWSTPTITNTEHRLPRMNCGIPNPYTLRTPIYCESLELGKDYQVNMIDMQGRSVYQSQVRGGQAFSIDLPLANGIYYLRIQEGGQLKHTQKLLIRP